MEDQAVGDVVGVGGEGVAFGLLEPYVEVVDQFLLLACLLDVLGCVYDPLFFEIQR